MRRTDFLKRCGGVAAGAFLLDFLLQEGVTAEPAPWPQLSHEDERFWRFLRDQFPLQKGKIYLNTGGLGASPYVVINALKGKVDELERICETGHDDGLLNEIRSGCGHLLGADPEEIAFIRNTTEGINIVARGLPLRRGDEIITTTQEHVGNIMPWLPLAKEVGLRIRFFEPSTTSPDENLERIAALTNKRTRLISIPHAITTTGCILPVREICSFARGKGIWSLIDGAQTAGMFPFSLHEIGCDAYATSGHKWLMGPKETGILYVRKEMLEVVATLFTGAHSSGLFDHQKGTYTFVPTAGRYEYGTVNIPLRVALGAAVGFVQRIGIERVWERDKFLSTRLFNGLKEISGVVLLSPERQEMRSAMITIRHKKLPYLELQKHLNEYDLRTRGVNEGGLEALRFSTHIYTMPEEVDRLLEGVRAVG